MIRQSFRMLLLAGLVISAVTAGGTVVAPGTTEARHHQPVPCEPDC
jgi:acyl dehydratase